MPTVLCIDDDQNILNLLEGLLAKRGFTVITTADGERGLAEAGRRLPDLILLDIMMPGIDGLEVLRQIRARPTDRPPYILMLTSIVDKKNIVAGLDAGANDYLIKPFDPGELRARIEVGRRQVEMQDELIKSREAAEESSNLKTNMVSLVSHEYSNALTTMKLAMMLLQEAPMPQDRDTACAALNRAIEHLCVSTMNFLNLNRVEAGQFRLKKRPTRLREVLHSTLEFLQPSIDAKGLSLELDFPEAPIPVMADPEALAIIASNLITNAVKYTPNGGTIRIRLSRVDGEPAQALVSVEDSGIGISAQDQKRILTGFYRTEESQKVAKGFGIGLTLIKELIMRHGSSLHIESEPEKGARFSFRLPVCAEEPGSQTAPESGAAR